MSSDPLCQWVCQESTEMGKTKTPCKVGALSCLTPSLCLCRQIKATFNLLFENDTLLKFSVFLLQSTPYKLVLSLRKLSTVIREFWWRVPKKKRNTCTCPAGFEASAKTSLQVILTHLTNQAHDRRGCFHPSVKCTLPFPTHQQSPPPPPIRFFGRK